MVLDLLTQQQGLVATDTERFEFVTTGLKPLTKHKLYLDGTDYSFAVRMKHNISTLTYLIREGVAIDGSGSSSDYGEDIISDSNGRLHFELIWHVPLDREWNTTLPETGQTIYKTAYDPDRAGVAQEIDYRVLFTGRNERDVDISKWPKMNGRLKRAYVLAELRSADNSSYAQYILQFVVYTIYDKVQRVTQISGGQWIL